MTRFLLSALLICHIAIQSVGQTDDIGSGRALQFDGVDDYIDLGDIYNDLKFPITISAWVYVDGSVTNWAPVFVSQDNAPVYNGFWFLVQPTIMAIGYGDGFGENIPDYRRGKSATFPSLANRWAHIAGVIRGATDMDLFVNGINVGGSYSGFSDSPMSSSLTDVAKIGFWYSNNQTFHYKGKLDDVRIWNRSLSQSEIRAAMCADVVGTEIGLIGAWNFNELSGSVSTDKSTNHFNGAIKNTPIRIYSGAPIGGQSLYNYRADWTGISVEINEGDDRMIVSNIKNNPEGIHLYKVTKVPSQVSGLDLSQSNKPYFGVFEAALDTDNSFDAVFLFQNKILCNVNERADNSEASWIKKGLPILARSERAEYVKVPGTVTGPTLGSDFFSCQESQAELDSKVADLNATFQWSTGETTSKITIYQSGTYWVKVFGACGVSSDTIKVNFLQPPLNFSLGEDQQLCPMNSTLLKPYSSSRDFEFKWQDGTEAASFIANDYGTFWVTAKNECGEASDTITFEKRVIKLDSIPNVITPNGDFKNEFFIVDKNESDEVSLLIVNRWGKQVYQSNNYKNNWNGDELATGVYFYTISGRCVNTVKGSISLIR